MQASMPWLVCSHYIVPSGPFRWRDSLEESAIQEHPCYTKVVHLHLKPS
jgi:hypothetical protein